jgi:23S rRNA (guanine2445-N2)-methyltransferase / 23S rRNA (guanine2069-N7)-methyltransferase
MEALLAAELSTLGATGTRETVAGVHFEGSSGTAYRACVWSRLANRILAPLISVDAADGDRLYQGLKSLDWGRLIDAKQTLAVDFSGENRHIRNTQYGSQRSKDAVVDWFQEHVGRRPSVDRRNPDFRLNIRLVQDQARVSVDFSGGSLHQRNYRQGAGEAPLKENLAAAILLRADWPGMAARGGALIDPMCGAGTLLLEGAMMVADIAPGLSRKRFGFEKLKNFNEAQWRAIVADARGRADRGRNRDLPEIRGYDADPRVVRRAQENVARAGLEKVVRISVKPLAEFKKPTHKPLATGLLVCNPPYGERLGEKESLTYLYRELGERMSAELPGWQAAIFTSDLELGRATGLRSHKRYTFYNGTIAARLLLFNLEDNQLKDAGAPVAPAAAKESTPAELSAGAQMFANRLRKNRKRLKSWLKQEQVSCYRLYDADMPEYAVAVDVYGDMIHVAEYQPPRKVDAAAAAARLEEVRQGLASVFDRPAASIEIKQRRRQRGSAQYEKLGRSGELMSVQEGRCKLLVNLADYLDTGLFLDHRPLRRRIGEEAAGGNFLNLFCYTGSATVHAALGGAHRSTSVDLSNTYLSWMRKNLAHNGLAESRHETVKADCLQWLQSADNQYDLILLDPPSFSNSSAMSDSFDVQRDHQSLVRAAMGVLKREGQLYFSNNRRGFRLDPQLLELFDCRDISSETLDPDFQRNPGIHCCWSIRHCRDTSA